MTVAFKQPAPLSFKAIPRGLLPSSGMFFTTSQVAGWYKRWRPEISPSKVDVSLGTPLLWKKRICEKHLKPSPNQALVNWWHLGVLKALPLHESFIDTLSSWVPHLLRNADKLCQITIAKLPPFAGSYGTSAKSNDTVTWRKLYRNQARKIQQQPRGKLTKNRQKLHYTKSFFQAAGWT